MKATRHFLISLEAKCQQECRSSTRAIKPSPRNLLLGYRHTLPKLCQLIRCQDHIIRLEGSCWTGRLSRHNWDYGCSIYTRSLYLTTPVVRPTMEVVYDVFIVLNGRRNTLSYSPERYISA
jgi:hypothetical protein